jgi:hypothetical protein
VESPLYLSIFIINGPDFNLLDNHKPAIYGGEALSDVKAIASLSPLLTACPSNIPVKSRRRHHRSHSRSRQLRVSRRWSETYRLNHHHRSWGFDIYFRGFEGRDDRSENWMLLLFPSLGNLWIRADCVAVALRLPPRVLSSNSPIDT